MKLIIAIVQNQDAEGLSKKFVSANIRATKLATTGGFLKQGNTTFLIGIENDRVSEVLKIVKGSSKTRQEYMDPMFTTENPTDDKPLKITVGGATVFVLSVEQFEHF